MAIIKCKMCGGDVELTADKTFGTCEFCGNTMTLKKTPAPELSPGAGCFFMLQGCRTEPWRSSCIRRRQRQGATGRCPWRPETGSRFRWSRR